MIFLSYIKMHFSYVKSNILCNWLNILGKHYLIVFTPENSLPRRSSQLRPPGLPPYPASHLTQPATRPCLPFGLSPPPVTACLPSLPAFPTCLPILLRHEGVANVARLWCHPRPLVKAVCMRCKSKCNPLIILHTPSIILLNPTVNQPPNMYPLQNSTYLI